MGKYDFAMPHGYSLEDLLRVQNRLFEMASQTADILEKNNFKYFIAFGTLLGAVRHKDFIPWDDDFDMFLFEEEYEEAVSCLRENLPSDIIVHDQKTDKTYYANWSKLRDVNSKTCCAAYPDDNQHEFTGINVDLYKLKKVERRNLDAFVEKEHIEFLVRKHDAGFMSEEEYWSKFCNWGCKFADYINAIKKSNSEKSLDEVFAFVVGIKKLEISEVFPLKKYRFRERDFWGPANADSFLSQAYGPKYLEPPVFDKRCPHCDSVTFSK